MYFVVYVWSFMPDQTYSFDVSEETNPETGKTYFYHRVSILVPDGADFELCENQVQDISENSQLMVGSEYWYGSLDWKANPHTLNAGIFLATEHSESQLPIEKVVDFLKASIILEA
jgi:hypothetical protein